MRYIKLEEVTQGMKLSCDILDNNHRILLVKGMILTPEYIKRLQNFGVYGIYIEDEWSNGIEIEETIDSNLQEDIAFALESLDMEKIAECAKNIVDALSSSRYLCNDMETLKEYDEYTYQHSINVAIMATELGIGLKCTMKQLHDLAMGGLLHDIGKRYTPIEIITKEGKLTDEEYSIVKKHPYNGYKMVSDDFRISSCVRQIIYQHHENYNGTGYPRQLKEDNIYKLAMITHICDVYDALISKRSYKSAFPISKAIQILNEGRHTMFDNDMVSQFFKYVPIYHKGTKVILDNEKEALVYENHRGNMLKPTVKLQNGRLIDLRQSKHWIIS